MFGRKRQMVQYPQHRTVWNHVNPYAPSAFDMSQSRQSNHQSYNQQAFYGGMNPYLTSFQQQQSPIFQQNGYDMQNYGGMGYLPSGQGYYQNHQAMMNNNTSIFQNPLDLPQENSYQNQNYHMQQNPYQNPYPKQSFIQKKPSGVQSIMNSFKGQDGSLDFNKMMDTAGQMMNAVSQVSNMVKGVGGMFKV
ncbi:YppG family protein [Cytobacillus gottheilii]|uniref:YppG family protein n=1 Tax=Cytobacillus gottheilii TaxID=859144 RepID=UPI002149484F|nr:YppG family protein [Cytobacillus gottheilii]